ncbi:MAG: hypothetical protein NTW16_03730, partial [Bacteroidetes bacterium]|nr:hypothetical protein [Bacteroidota bacterium]
HVNGTPCGTLTGNIKNSFTNANLAGVSVVINGGAPVLTNAAGVYTLTNVMPGVATIAATLTNFLPYSGTANIVSAVTTTKDFLMSPIPAYLAGTITNSANGSPIKGAKIVCNGLTTYSVEGGAYSLMVYPATPGTATISKVGFGSFTSGTLTFTPGVTTTLNTSLDEALNLPSTPFVAALNTPPTQVALTWGIPKGVYELIYDDGVQETSTDWTLEGNMNAVKFTALNYPVTVKGGSVNIGLATDYPNGTTIASLEPFQIQVYNATGTGGLPGTAVGDPIDVVPANFGWNSFTLPDIAITSGNFYLVMIQGGNDPVCARIGVDNTATQLRSYSRFVTGNGSWLPANGNFMLRAVVSGVGGPIDGPDAIVGYEVKRLLQTQEATPALWTAVSTPTATNTVDANWPSLPDGPYRWAVKAKYTGNRFSEAIFSNVIGKGWTASVTVNVTLTCDAIAKAGTAVKLTSTVAGVDSNYTALTDNTGKVVFPKVWKGSYDLKVTRFGFDNYTASVVIDGDKVYDINLLGMKPAPTGMTVNEQSLLTSWSPPVIEVVLLNEPFANYTTNGWTTQPNWVIIAGQGQPAPSAFFNWTPALTDYSRSLTSQSLVGIGAPGFKLSFDYNLGDFLNMSGDEHLSVEISTDNTNWVSLYQIDGGADILWTTKEVDLAAYTTKTFKLRFRAWGADTFNIDWWYLDNVKVVASDDASACIIAYNLYLNNVLEYVTTDTTYTIPSGHVTYGTNYDACVKAVYASGYSTASCDNFTSRFLCAPRDLAGVPQESTAYLTWAKPLCTGSGCTLASYIYDGNISTNGTSINAGYNIRLGNYFPVTPATTSGVIKSVDIYFSSG